MNHCNVCFEEFALLKCGHKGCLCKSCEKCKNNMMNFEILKLFCMAISVGSLIFIFIVWIDLYNHT